MHITRTLRTLALNPAQPVRECAFDPVYGSVGVDSVVVLYAGVCVLTDDGETFKSVFLITPSFTLPRFLKVSISFRPSGFGTLN